MDVIKVRVGKAADAKNASSVNQRRLQRSSTLNRRFVKKPTPVPRIRYSAGAVSRKLKAQDSSRRILISKGHAVKIQPREVKAETQVDDTIQQTAKVVQKVEKQLAGQTQAPAKTISRAVGGTVSLKGLSDIQPRKAALAKKKVERIDPAEDPEFVSRAKARMASRRRQPATAAQKMTAQELKDQAIKRALQKVSMMEESDEVMAEAPKKKRIWQKKKVIAATAMAVVSLALFGYLVSVNLPDISVRVAAMNSGIEKAFPSYVPATYRLDGLVKEENGHISMAFKNDRNQHFTLEEEKTSWDSSAVLTNYVLKNWGDDYTIAKGQGLTIYISGSRAAWVNGGVLYVITDNDSALTASDLHDIAVSL